MFVYYKFGINASALNKVYALNEITQVIPLNNNFYLIAFSESHLNDVIRKKIFSDSFFKLPFLGMVFLNNFIPVTRLSKFLDNDISVSSYNFNKNFCISKHIHPIIKIIFFLNAHNKSTTKG